MHIIIIGCIGKAQTLNVSINHPLKFYRQKEFDLFMEHETKQTGIQSVPQYGLLGFFRETIGLRNIVLNLW